jgi:hypothetical protein
MARSIVAISPARVDSVGGLARWLAHPTYQQLKRFEPWLRIVVPAMLAAFLAALAYVSGTTIRNQGSNRLSCWYVGCASQRARPPTESTRAGDMATMLRAMPSPFRIPHTPFGSTCRIYPNHRDLNPAALIWQEVNEGLRRGSAFASQDR